MKPTTPKPTTIAGYHAAQAPPDRAICDTLHDIICAALPDAQPRMWHAHPVWFLADNPVTGYSKLKSCLRLMFWSGQSFPSGGLTPSGSFKAAEARFTDAQQIDTDLLHLWLRDARDIQWDYKNIVKNKGRLNRLK